MNCVVGPHELQPFNESTELIFSGTKVHNLTEHDVYVVLDRSSWEITLNFKIQLVLNDKINILITHK